MCNIVLTIGTFLVPSFLAFSAQQGWITFNQSAELSNASIHSNVTQLIGPITTDTISGGNESLDYSNSQLNYSNSQYEMQVNFATYRYTCSSSDRQVCNNGMSLVSCTADDVCIRQRNLESLNSSTYSYDYPEVPSPEVRLACNETNRIVNISYVTYNSSIHPLFCAAFHCNGAVDSGECTEELCNVEPKTECGHYDKNMTLQLHEYCLNHTVEGECKVVVPRRMVEDYANCSASRGLNCSAEYNLCYAHLAHIGYFCPQIAADPEYSSGGLAFWLEMLVGIVSVVVVLGAVAGVGFCMIWRRHRHRH